MSYSFNLTDNAWIPCVTVDGRFVEVGWRDLLVHAHEIKMLACETALMNTALLAPTLAILHRVFGPASRDDWQNLWEQGHFSEAPIDAYLTEWYARFDLFDEQRPFYQMADDRVKPKTILHLIHSVGNTGTLFIHETDDDFVALTPASAAIHLITGSRFAQQV